MADETVAAPEMGCTSLTLAEVRSIKLYVTRGAAYAERVSLGFAIRLSQLREELAEDHIVLRELDVLEGIASNSSTKAATQFKRPPLHPFWHKHFSAPRHLMRNMGERWGLGKAGNADLSAMIEEVAVTCGAEPDLWQKRVVHELIGGLEDRIAAKRMTGDWIIFAKYDGKNFYLDLASHEEATHDPDRLLKKLRLGSGSDFPFLFQ